jgi:hypothetical protein
MSGLINPTPALQVFNAMTQAPYLKIVYFSGTPSACTLVVHPTSDGTATGTAVFSNIFHATATPWVPSGGVLSATPVIAGQSISTDFKTVTFSLVNVSGLASSATNTCTVVVYGAP